MDHDSDDISDEGLPSPMDLPDIDVPMPLRSISTEAPPDTRLIIHKSKHVPNTHWYKNAFPKKGELVIAEVIKRDMFGITVKLLEYGDLEGMVQTYEYSRRGNKSTVTPGRQFVCNVLNVDTDKRYIDLSKVQVCEADRIAVEEKYENHKKLNQMVRRVASSLNINPCEIYEKILYEMDDPIRSVKLAASCREAFTQVFNHFNIDTTVLKAIEEDISEHIRDKPVMHKCYVEVICFTPEGIDGIKRGLLLTKEKYPMLKICLKITPLYEMALELVDTNEAFNILNSAIEHLTSCMRSIGGDTRSRYPPHVSTKEQAEAIDDLIKEKYSRKDYGRGALAYE